MLYQLSLKAELWGGGEPLSTRFAGELQTPSRLGPTAGRPKSVLGPDGASIQEKGLGASTPEVHLILNLLRGSTLTTSSSMPLRLSIIASGVEASPRFIVGE